MCVCVGVCVQCGCWELDPSSPQEQQVLFNHWALSLDPRLCLNPIFSSIFWQVSYLHKTHKFYFSKILTLMNLSSTSNLEASRYSHLYFIDLLNMKLKDAHLMTSTIGMSGFKNRQLVYPAHNWKDGAPAPVPSAEQLLLVCWSEPVGLSRAARVFWGEGGQCKTANRVRKHSL